METKYAKAHHARSSSLPSVPHPQVVHLDELRGKLKSSKYTTSSSSISTGLGELLDLHECVDSLLLMPENRKALARKCNEKEANIMLDGSLRILDMCGAAKDSLLEAKESTSKLQSLLRRTSGNALIKGVKAYLSKRKMTKKSTLNVLRNSKDNQIINTSNDETWRFITGILRELDMATVAALESLLSFIYGSNGQAPSSKRSLVSKLILSGMISSKDSSVASEFNKVDATLLSLINQGTNKVVQSDKAQVDLSNLELTIEDLEVGVDSLFRTLIRKRVTLLNILNP